MVKRFILLPLPFSTIDFTSMLLQCTELTSFASCFLLTLAASVVQA